MKGAHGANRGFTLVELLVVIMIISSLAGILIPALGAARRYMYRVQCQHALSQIGKLAVVYADEHRGFLPFARDVEQRRAHESFQALVNAMPDARRPDLFVCPASQQESAVFTDRKRGTFALSADTVSYTWRKERTRLTDGSETMIVSCDKRIADGSAQFPENHRGGMNVLLPDCSARWLTLEDLEIESPADFETFLEQNELTE
jgi:prepilin-type N-terminal cleavage/methylation domain-containing protein